MLELSQVVVDRVVEHLATLSGQRASDTERGLEIARSVVEPMPEHGEPLEPLLDVLLSRLLQKGYNSASPGALSYRLPEDFLKGTLHASDEAHHARRWYDVCMRLRSMYRCVRRLASTLGAQLCVLSFASAALPRDHAAAPKPGSSGATFYVRSSHATIWVRGSREAKAEAVRAAAARLKRMLAGAPRIAGNLRRDGDEVHVFGSRENITNLPELRQRRGEYAGGQDWDTRYRGGEALGRFAECGEHNLLAEAGDPYPAGYDVCTHEIAHLVHNVGLDGKLRGRVAARYRAAIAAGLWRGLYAAKNENEFFAELSMRYFDLSPDRRTRDPKLHMSNAAFRAYDPRSFALIDEIYRGKLVPARVRRKQLALLPRSAAIAARSHPGPTPTTVIVENRTLGAIRLAAVDRQGNLQPNPHGMAAGTIDAFGGRAGDVLTVIDEHSRARIATVVLREAPGLLRVTDRMVKRAEPDPALQVSVPFQE